MTTRYPFCSPLAEISGSNLRKVKPADLVLPHAKYCDKMSHSDECNLLLRSKSALHGTLRDGAKD